ncbi:MAG: hypothetical protein NZO16_00940 [Deltaproteobacteria bacterium]|nr:hypothetical protein [Deltaproteobacteria bacterium]
MRFLFVLIVLFLLSCTQYSERSRLQKNADIVGSNMVGLATAGALTSAKLGAGSIMGVGVGVATAGVVSAIQNFALTRTEDSLLKLEKSVQFEYLSSLGQKLLLDYLDTKRRYHPSRDIFPASLIFKPDSTDLSGTGKALLTEIYNLNKDRFPWSRFGVIAYAAASSDNDFTRDLIIQQTKSIGNYLVSLGLNPRRITLLGAVTNRPLVPTPPELSPFYLNAIEFVPLDLITSDASG